MSNNSLRRIATWAAVGLSALALVGCSTAGADDGSGTRTEASGSAGANVQTVKIGIVPTLDLGFLTVGEQQGFFADQGIKLEITPVDSGPNVITGLVAKQYDLPFNQIADNVASGKLDAGLGLQPYLAQGLKAHPELTDLGDAAVVGFPPGTPSGGIFTAASTLQEKPELFAKFKAAFAKSVEYGNAHLDDVRAAGAKLSGLSAKDAALIPLQKVDSTVTAADFDPLLTAMRKFGWISKDIDIDKFLGKS